MGFCAIPLKILAKDFGQGYAGGYGKSLEIQALFVFLCIAASCWLSMKTNSRRRLWRNFSGHLDVGFVQVS